MRRLPVILLLLTLRLPAAELYQIVFLRPDPARTQISAADAERIQTAHMAGIHNMADRGLLIAAGPFEDKTPTISGIFIFKGVTNAEARRNAAQDPTVLEHRNLVDVLPWQGPKGLGEEYKQLHAANPATPEGMGVQPFVMLHRTASWDKTSPAAKSHDAWIKKLLENHKLATAGPVPDNNDVSEILIFNRIPDDEAAQLSSSDPAVAAGLLKVDLHRWWCAAHVLPEEDRKQASRRRPPR